MKGGVGGIVATRRRIWRRRTNTSIDKRRKRRIANLTDNDMFDQLHFHSSNDPDFSNMWPTSWLV